MNAGATMERITEPVKILLSAMSDEPTMMLHTGINIAALRRALLTFIVAALIAVTMNVSSARRNAAIFIPVWSIIVGSSDIAESRILTGSVMRSMVAPAFIHLRLHSEFSISDS